MFKRAVVRGVVSGAVAGLAYGLYVAVVATPLIRYVETFEAGGEASAVPDLVAALGSVAGGILYGILLGAAAFGVLFYFLEPVLPGTGRTKRSVLAAAGFLVVSGVPWLALPPVPPGVEQSLPTDVRLGWYAGGMAVGALACAMALGVYKRIEPTHGQARAVIAASVGLVPAALFGVAAPTNQLAGSVPEAVSLLFTVSTVVGQVGLWALLATVHWWLSQRARTEAGSGAIPSGGMEPPRPPESG